MSHPTFEDARQLVGWRPPHGVLSVYVRFDPADRGGAWRTGLRNGLAGVLEATSGADHDARVAIKATAERVSERFANYDRDLPKGEVGFVEVSNRSETERWWAPHVAPEADVCACIAERPVLAPLIYLSEHGCPRGIALLSAERVRLFEWAPGELEELESLDLAAYSRERRPASAPDSARGQGVSTAGRDRFDDRLGDNRERFLVECGRRAAGSGGARRWLELDVFGAADHVRCFRQGAAGVSGLPVEVAGEVDLVSNADEGELEARIMAATRRLAVERDLFLIDHVLEEARGGTRGATGPEETWAALDEGRVSHLVTDAAHAIAACSGPVVAAERAPQNGGFALEPLIGRALTGSAKISTVVNEAAEKLAPVGGVAALLRY